MAGRSEFTALDITSILQTALSPIISKIQTLDEKVDHLAQDRVTRTDIEKLTLTFVQRDTYEARHAVLIDRDKGFEDSLRELRKEYEMDIQRLRDRLENDKQQLDDRFKQQQETQLSDKDRFWVRCSLATGWIATVISILSFLLSHIKIN